MGCPGWPLCYGNVAPTHGFHAQMEQSHRYLASIVTVLVIATFLLVRMHRPRLNKMMLPSICSVVLILVQVVLGAVTVITHNAPITVALHLITGLVFAGATTVTYVASIFPEVEGVSATCKTFGAKQKFLPGFRSYQSFVALVATFLVMISGSIVVDGGGEKSCPGWPICSFKEMFSPLGLTQLAHRSIVLIASIAIGLFLYSALKDWRDVPRLYLVSYALAGLLCIQIGVGAASAIFKAPSALQDIHLAFAAGIWITLVILVSLGWYSLHPQEVLDYTQDFQDRRE